MNERQYDAYFAHLHDAPANAPWNLAALSDTERSDVLQHLATWVRWLIERFALADLIPACWARHGALVEELLALHMAWRAAYTDPAAPGNAPLTWMEAFERTRHRLQEWNRWGCAGNRHRPEPPSNGTTATSSRHQHHDSHQTPQEGARE